MSENAGKKTPGVDGALWDTPEKKAAALARLGHWRGYHPQPLKRRSIAKAKGKPRPLSIPTREDRARQAVYRQALQPSAEPTADGNAYGFRPTRQGAEAIEQCFKLLRQQTSAQWILAGEIAGFFDTIAFPWLAEPMPMKNRGLSKWLRRGFVEPGKLCPTTTGVPQGGSISPVSSTMGRDGLAAVGQESAEQRRLPPLNFVRWADDCIVTAASRQVLEDRGLPRITTF